MSEPAVISKAPPRPPQRRVRRGGPVLRVACGCTAFLTAVVMIAVFAFAALSWRLGQGPISLDAFVPRITQALQQRLAGGYLITLSGAALERRGTVPTLVVTGLTIKDGLGQQVISAPKAEVDFDPRRLLRRDVGLQRIALIGPQFKASISRQGEISFVTAFQTQPQGQSAADAASAQSSPDATPPLPAASDHARHGLVAAYDDLFGPRGPFKVISYVGIEDGRLVVDDERTGEQIVYSEVKASFERDDRESVHLELRGPSGEWSVNASIERGPGSERRLVVMPKDAPVGDVLLPVVPRPLALAPDMPVSGKIAIEIGGDDKIKSAVGELTAGAAAWNKPGEKSPVIVTDEISAAFSYDASSGAIDVGKIRVLAGDTDLSVKGRIAPAADGNFSFAFNGSGTVGGASPGEGPIALDRISIAGDLSPHDARIRVAPLELSGKNVALAMNADYLRGRRGGLTLAIQSGRMPARALLALWPHGITEDVRKYLVERVQNGVVERFSLTNSFNDVALAEALANRPVPDEAVSFSADISDTSLHFSDDMPSLTSAAAHIAGTGHTTTITLSSGNIDLGDGRVMQLSDGRFHVADTTKKPATAQVSFHVQAGADAFVAAMQQDTPRNAAHLFSPDKVSGNADANVQFKLVMRDGVKPKDVPVTMQGTVSKLAVQDIGAGQKLDNAQLSFALANGVMTAKGEGRFAGAAANIELHKEAPDAPPQVKLAMTLDDAARTKLGLHAGHSLTGPMPVKITSTAEASGTPAFDVDADLTRVAIDGLVPGWTKPAGRPGKLSFRLLPGDDATRFTKIALAAAPAAATGEVTMAKDGTLLSAKLDSFKISPGDDLHVEVSRGDDNVFKTAVKGAAIDLRPFIKRFLAGSESDTQDTDLDLKVASATGFGDEKGAALDLHLSRRGLGLSDFHFAGQIGKSDVVGTMGQEGRRLITIETKDAGAFLRFTDLYRHMDSGTMVLRLTPSVGSQAGAVSIRDFSLRNEEQLARLFSAAPTPQAGAETSAGASAQINPADVDFDHMEASFVRSAGLLDVHEAVIIGNQAGITLSGPMNFARNTAKLSGTFVPAYQLNNAVSKVPLFGPLLSGGANGGLLAVNFHVSGALSQPDVAVNILTVLTPGFLRNLFDIGSPRPADVESDVDRAHPPADDDEAGRASR